MGKCDNSSYTKSPGIGWLWYPTERICQVKHDHDDSQDNGQNSLTYCLGPDYRTNTLELKLGNFGCHWSNLFEPVILLLIADCFTLNHKPIGTSRLHCSIISGYFFVTRYQVLL